MSSEDSIRNKKLEILDKVKKEFDGSGSIWKFICSSDTLYLDELRFIADINGIENSSTLTKQDLCRKLEHISTYNKNKVLTSCQNESDISGDDIKDIPAEYFFTYEENGKPYCTDIRSAYANIKAGNNKNPYTNVEIPQETRDKIVQLYEADIKLEEVAKPTLTQILADFSSKIPYLNSVELYKNATKEQLEKFYDMIQEYPTYEGRGDIDELHQGTLEQDKYIIINSLLLDRNFEDFKYQLRDDYNRIFRGIARPVLDTLKQMVAKISPELNADHIINASREQVNKFIEAIEYPHMIEDLEEDRVGSTLEEYKYNTLQYIVYSIYGDVYNSDDIDEELLNSVVDIYNEVFRRYDPDYQGEYVTDSPEYVTDSPDYVEDNEDYEADISRS